MPIAALGRRALPLQMDVTRRDQIARRRPKRLSTFGRIDILVNNAGIGPPNPAEAVTEADFDRTLAVNLKGTFFVSQAVGRVMIERRRRTDRQPRARRRASSRCPPSRSTA